MGAKEERLPVRYVFGYSGQMRPMQVEASKCDVCGQVVWITYKKPSREYRETKGIHFACQKPEHRS